MTGTVQNVFRTAKVYGDDYPPNNALPPYNEDLAPYSVKRLVEVSRTHLDRPPQAVVLLEHLIADGLREPESNRHRLDQTIYERGLQLYKRTVAHEQFAFSVMPNLRDIEGFAEIPGLRTGMLFRAGYPLSHDPVKIAHILQYCLQVRTIFDLRGYVPLATSGNSTESVSRSAVLSLYEPRVFCSALKQWLFVEPRTETSAEHVAYYFNMEVNSSPFPAIANCPSSPAATMTHLLVAGGCFLGALLRALIEVNLPVLICSTHGRDRVGVVCMLILSVLGATDEAMVSDYCASEIAYPVGNPEYRKCEPAVARNVLKFLRTSFGSINAYLDSIGVDENVRDSLRSRLECRKDPKRILYELPQDKPFWTENPGIFVPSRKLPLRDPPNILRHSAAMARVMKVSALLNLRDTFEEEISRRKTSGWSRLLRRLRRVLQRRKAVGRQGRRSTLDVGGYEPRVGENFNNLNLERKASKIRWKMGELILAKNIVLAKLGQQLKRLQLNEIPKFLQFRNTQIYARRNSKMAVSNAPSLEQVYLEEPDLFTGERIDKAKDVLKILTKKLRGGESLSLYPWMVTGEMQPSAPLQKIEEIDGDLWEAERPSYKYVTPDFFFHELADKNRRREIEASTDKPLPATFAEWLMSRWMVPVDSPPLENPFVKRADECFAAPQLLANYIRAIRKEENVREENPGKDESTAAGRWITSRLSASGQFEPLIARTTPGKVKPKAEEEFFEALRQCVPRTSCSPSTLLKRVPVGAVSFCSVVSPIDIDPVEDTKKPHVFDLMKARGRMTAAKSHFEQLGLERSIREEITTLRKQFLGTIEETDDEAQYRQNMRNIVAERLCMRRNESPDCTPRAQTLLKSVLPAVEDDDFNSDDERDWVIQHVVQAEVGQMLQEAETVRNSNAIKRGTKKQPPPRLPELYGMFHSEDLFLTGPESVSNYYDDQSICYDAERVHAMSVV